MILVLDTATPSCTAALFAEDGQVLARSDEVMPRGHAERLMPLLDELLDGRCPDTILVGCGPGSFTGLRVGIAGALGLGLGWQIPVHGFSTAALLAAGAAGEGPIGVAMIGGHGELFVQQFDRFPMRATTSLESLTPEAAAAALDAEEVVGSGAATLVAERGFGTAGPTLPEAANVLLLPEDLRRLAPRPLYVRAPDAKAAA